MKKLLFVLAFTFIGQQAFSQIYIVTLSYAGSLHPSGCTSLQTLCLTKTDPTGAQTYTCIGEYFSDDPTPLSILSQELNSIVNQGYKLIETNNGYGNNDGGAGGLIDGGSLSAGTTWYFAIP